MSEFLKTLLIACIPAIITGIVSYLVANKNATAQIRIIKEQNKHDLDKLMEQHKVDIDSLKEKYRLEAEAKEQEHLRNIELLKLNHQNSIEQKDNEEVSKALFGALGQVFGTVIDSTVKSDKFKEIVDNSLSDAFNKEDK